MRRKQFHVVPAHGGGWDIISNRRKMGARYTRKRLAVTGAICLAKRFTPSQVLVHNRDGKIAKGGEYTYGGIDPCPPRG